MCTVLLRFAPGGPRPLLVGAVRDEFVDRAWDPPARHWPPPAGGGRDEPRGRGDRLIGGRDRIAGGTWLAVDPERPALAAVLNGVHLPPPTDGIRPSRGRLPLAALRGQPLPDPAVLARFDGFHLVHGTPDEVRVWSWDGATLGEQSLRPGDQVVVNAGVGAAAPAVTAALGAVADPQDWRRLLTTDTVLVDRTVAGRRYASTSTSLVELTATGVTYDFNPTPRELSGWYAVSP